MSSGGAMSTDFKIQQKFQVDFSYPVVFTEGAFAPSNRLLSELLQSGSSTQRPRVLAIIDAQVCKLNSALVAQLENYALVHGIDLVQPPLLVTGGEQAKKDGRQLDLIYGLVAEHGIDRHSFILVIGGGALLDAVGYAAATAHRGVRLIRMPTTVLAQNDAGIGVKNGVNHSQRKNFLGTFAPPYGVINDFQLLATLSERDRRAGMAEAVKVALIKDRKFFSQLFDHRFRLAAFEKEAVRSMIILCAQLHLDHIANSGDPFEMGSARPLDFGHWSAHRLEYLSGYQCRHGEAVAAGIALDVLYSHEMDMIDSFTRDQILTLLLDLGFDLAPEPLKIFDVKEALNEFREHLGGRLCITLLTAIGEAKELDVIDVPTMSRCVEQLRGMHHVSKNVTESSRSLAGCV